MIPTLKEWEKEYLPKKETKNPANKK